MMADAPRVDEDFGAEIIAARRALEAPEGVWPP